MSPFARESFQATSLYAPRPSHRGAVFLARQSNLGFEILSVLWGYMCHALQRITLVIVAGPISLELLSCVRANSLSNPQLRVRMFGHFNRRRDAAPFA